MSVNIFFPSVFLHVVKRVVELGASSLDFSRVWTFHVSELRPAFQCPALGERREETAWDSRWWHGAM